jgi:acetyltransferase-like isoleucine patch superfamily enzyme
MLRAREVLGRPTPAPVKRAAAALGIDAQLKRYKRATQAADAGARLQAAFWVGGLPIRKLRHACYRRMGLTLGSGAVVHRRLELRAASGVQIGDGTVIGFDVILDGRRGIAIGAHVNVSSEVAIWTLQHDHRDPKFGDCGGRVTIGDRAWLSFRATILPSVNIGEGAVVAAGALVTRDVPPYAIVAGVPARVVGWRSPRELSYELGGSAAPWFV